MMNDREKRRSQWQLIIIFGCFSMLSNFTGVQIRGDEIINGTVYNHLSPDASLANTRVLTIGVSGLIGGPFVLSCITNFRHLSCLYRRCRCIHIFNFFNYYCTCFWLFWS